MKKRREHLVPLSRQALAVLRELYALTGNGEFLFPGLLGRNDRPLSNNSMNAALRRMGYSREEMTCHGFRTIASTLLNEQGFPPDVIELQLAHAGSNEVRAIYNRSTRLAERRSMMQEWADYLDRLRSGSPRAAEQRPGVGSQDERTERPKRMKPSLAPVGRVPVIHPGR
jgi:integrase